MMFSKQVLVDYRAKKEMKKFPREIQARIKGLLQLLGELGYLEPPTVKKIQNRLYELRLQKSGSWRVLFSYFKDDIIVLSSFRKKTNKSPLKEIVKAVSRAKEYKK